jgi:hypothetical protein
VTTSARKGTVTIRSGKGDAYREVALNALVRAVLEEWIKERERRVLDDEHALFLSLKGTRISPRAADSAIRRVAGDADLELSAHVLRHTCPTNLVRQGDDLVMVAELAGHVRIETTRRYSLPSKADRQAAMERMDVDFWWPGWPSPAERRALDEFPEQIGPEDPDEHFKLSPADLRFALKHRGDSRLGVAVQLCALRWLGFVPEELTAIPQPALMSLRDQLEANAADLDTYGARWQTRTDQLTAARTHARRLWSVGCTGVGGARGLAYRASDGARASEGAVHAGGRAVARPPDRAAVGRSARPVDRRGARARASGDVRRARRPARRPRDPRPPGQAA